MFRNWLALIALPALVAGAMLAMPDTAHATRFRAGVGTGGPYAGYGGYGYGNYGGYGYGNYGGYGYGNYGGYRGSAYDPGYYSAYSGYGRNYGGSGYYGYGDRYMSPGYSGYGSRYDRSPYYSSGYGYYASPGTTYYGPGIGTGYYANTYTNSSPYRPMLNQNEYRSFYPQDSGATVLFELKVPPDAEVWFNDSKTQQTGPDRLFVSPPVTPGSNYSYEIRVKWMKDGKETEEKRTVTFQAGQQSPVSVDFTTPR